jgi:hypothetical protein
MRPEEVARLFEPLHHEVQTDPIINMMMSTMLANTNWSLEEAFQHLVQVTAESRKAMLDQLLDAYRHAPAIMKIQGVDMAGMVRPDGTRW